MKTPRLSHIVPALALTLVLVGLAPVASAQTSPSELHVGANVHAFWNEYDTTTRAAVFDRLADAGIEWIRVDVGWINFETKCQDCRTQWAMDRFDEILDQAAARDLKVLAMLWRTPSWANGGDMIAPPNDPDDFGHAAGWIAEAFRGRVAAWQVWNEPNHSGFFHGTAEDYVEMLRAAGPAIRAADPDTTVVLGGPSRNDTDWLRRIYEAGAAGYFDAMSTQPYQGPADLPPEAPADGSFGRIRHVEAVRDLMIEFGDEDTPIWFTEMGWSSHPSTPDTPAWRRGVTEAQQADYTIRALEMIRTDYPYVTHVFWYVARTEDSGDEHTDGYGLLRRDLTPKPVFTALRDYLQGADGPETPGATDDPAMPNSSDAPESSDAPATVEEEPQTTLPAFVDDDRSMAPQDIRWIAEQDITRGCTPDRYCPDRPVTRAQMASFLTRALDLDTTRSGGFFDVDATSPFADDIAHLVAAGITHGCAPDRYCPDQVVTRAQMASFLRRALEN